VKSVVSVDCSVRSTQSTGNKNSIQWKEWSEKYLCGQRTVSNYQ